jgi:hypothetical protein
MIGSGCLVFQFSQWSFCISRPLVGKRAVESRMGGRGRDASCPAPPAQVPACVFHAPGSYQRSDAVRIRGLAAQSSSDA